MMSETDAYRTSLTTQSLCFIHIRQLPVRAPEFYALLWRICIRLAFTAATGAVWQHLQFDRILPADQCLDTLFIGWGLPPGFVDNSKSCIKALQKTDRPGFLGRNRQAAVGRFC
jgi:hypothetical protein